MGARMAQLPLPKLQGTYSNATWRNVALYKPDYLTQILFLLYGSQTPTAGSWLRIYCVFCMLYSFTVRVACPALC